MRNSVCPGSPRAATALTLALLLTLGVAQTRAEAPFVPPSWITRPLETDSYFPIAAQHARLSGRVELNCLINLDTTLDCIVASEDPAGWGFGEAAVQISKTWRINPGTRGGVPVQGVHLSVPVTFHWS